METCRVRRPTTITTVAHSSARPDSVDRLLDNPGVHVGPVVGGSKEIRSALAIPVPRWAADMTSSPA